MRFVVYLIKFQTIFVLTWQSAHFDYDNRHPAQRICQYDDSKPLGNLIAVLGLSGRPTSDATGFNLVDHPHVGVTDEDQRQCVDKDEHHSWVLPTLNIKTLSNRLLPKSSGYLGIRIMDMKRKTYTVTAIKFISEVFSSDFTQRSESHQGSERPQHQQRESSSPSRWLSSS